MKKQITILALVLFTFLSFQSLYGQEDSDSKSKFGLGVSLFNLVEYEYDNDFIVANSIYMTIELGDKFRLEPTIGFVLGDGSGDYSIGLGFIGKKAISKFNVLYGLRLGYTSNETTVIAPTIGGEYYFIKNFSIGSEVQLRGLVNGGDWLMVTNSSVIVRFYF